jgi:pyruvate/2-oxoglutarate dehydrogenase complex dihydrolipoamide acyltransferase (E2) component
VPELVDDYIGMVKGVMERHYHDVTRYTSNTFLRIKLGEALEKLAPDAGIISARSATVGATVPAGQELFRLIRGGRLEWRAEVPPPTWRGSRREAPADHDAGRRAVEGQGARRRADRGPAHPTRWCMSTCRRCREAHQRRHVRARRIRLGASPALTVPQSAVLLREGFAYVFRLEPVARCAGQGHARPPRRRPGRSLAGSTRQPRGGSGVGFLADGDTVRVVDGERGESRRNERLCLVDPQPHSGGAAVRHADAGGPAGLQGHEDPAVHGHRPADGDVTASLPGAAPAQMETEVARKIENSVATLQGIKHIYTKVQDGTAIVTVEFRLEKPRRRRSTTCATPCRASAPTCRATCATR